VPLADSSAWREYASHLPFSSGTGVFRVEAIDAAMTPFFFRTGYTGISREMIAMSQELFSADGALRLDLDSANLPIDRLSILSSWYPIPRTGIDTLASQFGPAWSIAMMPSNITFFGSNTLTLRYDEIDPFAHERSLRIHHWDDGQGKWELIGGTLDTAHHEVSATITRTGIYALFTTMLDESPGEDNSPIELNQNHPNPFDNGTTFDLKLNNPVSVSVGVYDLLGRRVRTLLEGSKPAGIHHIAWDGLDGDGIRVPEGVYFCRAKGEGEIRVVKVIVQRGSE
jgi:hypothetical protein